ncbi:calcineurin-like phosphoesterase C-terminal domain-containing protein [Parvularcula lutaonensis]|uniref:Calcineurin-like phosphoesterase C-terminal domain-containing protein n=1 Tax=Parvularcula lutaonensis TaxID=491923 RepID=A0ABV7MA05_9PROT|nr:calcineurin-like phosphoesterase C-terminal domain-containing protein [Parvularcula lutaonensis]GGY47663.1 hypothetical protein GCM10007148_16330 [Parvularcula lutaonensis]
MLRRAAFLAASTILVACETVPADGPAPGVAPHGGPLFSDYRGAPEIIRGSGSGGDQATGTVFEDLNRNGTQDPGEPGIPYVKVSNGLDVVLTGQDGSYALPKRDDMAVFVIQPRGYQVPHNEHWVPQFAYQHKPNGSVKAMRFGGMAPTGPLPAAINFPLVKASASERFTCAVLGDTQTYSNTEIGYLRDSTIDDILDRPRAEHPDCTIIVGDVVGDDLGLFDRVSEIVGTLQAPQWWAPGNHDMDLDADSDDAATDTWRANYGPNYYAFEIGNTLFIVLDNIVYPCTEEDAARAGREFCTQDQRKRYNGRITDEQMTFVRNLLEASRGDELVVFAHHIPLVSFMRQDAPEHQTDNAGELHALVDGRKALDLAGHTHTAENLSPGDSFASWREVTGVGALPFRHLVVGSAAGAWYGGDFDHHGVPMALQPMGAPRGWVKLDISGTDYVESYFGSNVGRERTMWTSVNTPIFRSWYNQIMNWRAQDPRRRDPVPPLSINDLPDVQTLTPRDLSRGSYLTANVWFGSSESSVELTLDGRTIPMVRTQDSSGEAPKVGAEWADPFATQRQLSVARFAMESRSGLERNQGVEAANGIRTGPAAPQPQYAVADRNVHLWRARLPEDLPLGVHRAVVTTTDRHGRTSEDTIVIEIREQLPPARFRSDVFDAFENGPPVR